MWSRQGTDGVYIKRDSKAEEVHLPRELIRALVAEDIRSKQISRWGNMTAEEILDCVGNAQLPAKVVNGDAKNRSNPNGQ
jgi:hypothetical protein